MFDFKMFDVKAHVRLILFVFLCASLGACSALRRARSVSTTQDLEALQMKLALQYFLDQSNPRTGLTRDRAQNFRSTPDDNHIASIASTGFSLAVIANASERNEVTPEFARAYALKTLKFCRDHVARHDGWFLHFVDWETGNIAIGAEYSTIDTTWFMAGAMYAAQILKDKQISAIVHNLYLDLNFTTFLTDGGTKPDKVTLSMGWKQDEGYTENQWTRYSEQAVMLLMGLAHPKHPIPKASWFAWDHTLKDLPNGEKMMGIEGSLFVHQYSQLFIDFRQFDDGFPNYAQNSVVATRWQRGLIKRDPANETLRAGFWGFSAGESPHGYEGWDPLNYQGVACIGCSIASAMLMPEEVLGDMLNWYRGSYHDQIWGRYGFTDSIDIGRNWFSPTVLGITVGPAYISLANLSDKFSVWKDFMKIPEIHLGLTRAGTIRTAQRLSASGVHRNLGVRSMRR